ncbi:hypothetical protein [Undibacterium sp.]|uniref:hypothetical protein n=1 Tax=Undibacterium sp. TaxID=1914977 RepID=UPI003750F60B
MNIKQRVIAALSPVLNNTWAVELPSNPMWPAIIFDIETQPEKGWVMGGGYEQLTVSVVILAKTQAEISALHEQVKVAMKAVAGYLEDGDHGDADYEPDASVYGYYSNHVVRMRQ